MKPLSLVLAACLALLSAAARAQEPPSFHLARIFTDNMVLQQQKPIRVWGWSGPGDRVSVTLTQHREAGEAAAAELAAAQDDNRRGRQTEEDDAYAASVQYVEKNAPPPIDQTRETTADAKGRWSVEFERAQASFQPTWIIARSGDRLAVVQNALVGEVWVCAGQSNMAWKNFNRKDREAASADFPGLRYVAWEDSYYKPLDDIRKNVRWQECSPETAQQFSAVPYLFGMFLHRYLKVPVGVINVARGGTTGQTWVTRENLDRLDDPIIKHILADYDAQTATWEDPAKVEEIMADWEKSVEEARREHKEKVARAKAEGKKEPRLRLPKKPGDPRSGWSPPAGLFNATVMPIRRLGVRGVLYYQGENNNFLRWTQYESTFPQIPVSFRQAFGEANLPFGCISQPGWGRFGLDPEVATVAEGYANVRDIQRRALKDDPHAAMIATYPTGNSYIHPGEKAPVGEYASLWALANVYDAPVMHRGPRYRELQKKDGKLYLFFDVDPVVETMIKPGQDPPSWLVLPCAYQGNAELEGFIIAGEDRRWFPAKGKHAKLDGQWCLEVSSDLVADPVAARYGWANWPTGNLVGRNNLPVPLFRTDDWPLVEGVSHTPEARQRSSEHINQLKQEGELQALDRKIRRRDVDLPELEMELYVGKLRSEEQLIARKVERLEAVLDELEKDPWLSRTIERNHKPLVDEIQAVREKVDALKKAAADSAEKSPVSRGEDKPKFYDPVEKNIEGWTVAVDPQLLEGEHAEVGAKALKALANHLQRITYILDEEHLAQLQRRRIWIEYENPILKNMQYHPGRGWLVGKGLDPRLVKHVHIPRAEELLKRHTWAKHPYVVLHELAHAYHDQELDFKNPEVVAAYESAKKEGIYDNVLLYTGKQVKHYALTTPMEYFAESSEAYLGVNDFYPFVRAELKEHDPRMYDLMVKFWGPVK
jgi:hypothetical protein